MVDSGNEKDPALLTLLQSAHRSRERAEIPAGFAAGVLRELRTGEDYEAQSYFSVALWRAIPGALLAAMLAAYIGYLDGSPIAQEEQDFLVQSNPADFMRELF